MYRSVVSFDEETAAELLLNKQKDWQNYIENHIMTIAEKNGIKREHLQWACALHREKNHPHIHLVFWDTSSQVKNPFTHPSIPNAIRKQDDSFSVHRTEKRTHFAEKIRAFGEEKNLATADLRQISAEADKIIANRILGMVKALNRLDGEYRTAQGCCTQPPFASRANKINSIFIDIIAHIFYCIFTTL